MVRMYSLIVVLHQWGTVYGRSGRSLCVRRGGTWMAVAREYFLKVHFPSCAAPNPFQLLIFHSDVHPDYFSPTTTDRFSPFWILSHLLLRKADSRSRCFVFCLLDHDTRPSQCLIRFRRSSTSHGSSSRMACSSSTGARSVRERSSSQYTHSVTHQSVAGAWPDSAGCDGI